MQYYTQKKNTHHFDKIPSFFSSTSFSLVVKSFLSFLFAPHFFTFFLHYFPNLLNKFTCFPLQQPIAIFFLCLVSLGSCSLNLVRDLVQFNLAGHPVLHKEQSWPFDPEIGARRARQYQEINGVHGEKAIELLGLGIDGLDRERLAKQRARDEGHLGGLNFYQP